MSISRTNRLSVLALCCATFFGLGLFTSSLGPNLPEIAAMAASPLAALGAIFTAIYLGSGVAQPVVGPLNDRFGERPTLFVALIVSAVGTVGIATSHALALTLGSALLLGLGGGAILISGSVLVAEVFASRSVPALNVLNV